MPTHPVSTTASATAWARHRQQSEDAVAAGYWHLYRFDPRLEAEGKNPFQLDSKEPDWSKFQDFLKSEVRYTSLAQGLPRRGWTYLFKAG
ncbi:MAG: hypothetical protein MZV63_04475 [Marinilabiliales bacterium]|nr:hypothetical protein [Marinilabiliales bacterium]